MARHDLDDAAERIAGRFRGVHALDHRALGHRIEAAHRGTIRRLVERSRKRVDARRRDSAKRDDVAPDLHAELVEQPAGQCAGSHPRGRLAGAGPLEDVASIEAIVLEHTDEVGMAGPGARHAAAAMTGRALAVRLICGRSFGAGALRCHHIFPVGPVPVGNQHRDRRPECLPGAHPGDPLDPVLLDLHPGSTPVALHPATELPIHPGRGHGKTRGEALDDRDEATPMGFPRRGEGEMHPSSSI